MDSLTQIVLGASVGEAVLGKKVGNKAALWGGICGTIPDLDVLANPFLSELDALLTHRGVTHSLLFCLVMAPIMGQLIHRIHRHERAGPGNWARLAFWALVTHPILDSFTTWGTQLFYPFSDFRVAFNSIFVVDPFYTVPFLGCLLVALFLHREKRARRIWNWMGIAISSFYLVLTITNKQVVDAVFTNSLHKAGKSVQRISTYPTPMNNFLWYVVAEEPSGFDIGYYSVFSDPNVNIDFVRIPKNRQLIRQYQENRVIERLNWVSKGFYTVEERGDTLIWNDLRFGLLDIGEDPLELPIQPVFAYELEGETGEWTGIRQRRANMNTLDSGALGRFWDKIWGE